MNKDFKNINVLKRIDPSILEIKDVYSHVVVYQLVDRKWIKAGIEGTGFLVLADSLGLFVMNRLGIENHQLSFAKIEKLEVLDEYMFYSTSAGIYGIWIYDVKDRTKFHANFSQIEKRAPQSFKEFKNLWDFIDPHNQHLDYVNFAHRIQVILFR